MPSKDPKLRLADILENIERIERYTSGLDESGLAADERTCDAVERCLERISEAARKLGEQGPILDSSIPWASIAALGNRLRHEYDSVRADLLWEIINDDLPALRRTCETACGNG